MLNKRITANGKIYADINNLHVWDENPKIHTENGLTRLKKQIALLGQYKPSLVTEDGLHVGGNGRFIAMQDLNKNLFTYTDKNGEHTIDRRGSFNEIWVTELAFGPEEKTDEQTGVLKTVYHAILDGKVQERTFDSIKQIMIEYALSDNDESGQNDSQALAELTQPYLELMPPHTYHIELQPSVSLETFATTYNSDHTDKHSDNDNEVETKKGKEIIYQIKFTPEQFSEVEPRIEAAKNQFGVENSTDLFMHLLEQVEFDHTQSSVENANNAQQVEPLTAEQGISNLSESINAVAASVESIATFSDPENHDTVLSEEDNSTQAPDVSLPSNEQPLEMFQPAASGDQQATSSDQIQSQSVEANIETQPQDPSIDTPSVESQNQV